MPTQERQLEEQFIEKLSGLKYEYREDIRDRAALEQNFRQKFEALNRVTLTQSEFSRLLEEITTPDVFTAARTLRERNSFTRDDGTPLNYTLVNIKDWCKNTFEVINQLRINTANSHHRYDVLILINGVPVVQVELKTLGINPRRAMEQIVDYKNDPGNGYTRTLLCFLQLFIVSNRDSTYYFANNNARHFAFNAEERFLPIYQFADEANKKITHLDDFADTFLVKCTLGQTISRYMVLIASEQKLMMMRPYQIYAVKAIVDCIHQNCGNGYIWHTTGSGKTLTSFKASTLLKDKGTQKPSPNVDQLDFEFVLFASAVIDYDYIMGLIARYAGQTSGKIKLSRDQLVALIRGQANLMDDGQDIIDYVDSLKDVKGTSETTIRDGYQRFKAEQQAKELAELAQRHGLDAAALQTFVDGILQRMIFDGEQLSQLYAPYDLGWKERSRKELRLMEDCAPYLVKRAQGRDISGLNAYE